MLFETCVKKAERTTTTLKVSEGTGNPLRARSRSRHRFGAMLLLLLLSLPLPSQDDTSRVFSRVNDSVKMITHSRASPDLHGSVAVEMGPPTGLKSFYKFSSTFHE